MADFGLCERVNAPSLEKEHFRLLRHGQLQNSLKVTLLVSHFILACVRKFYSVQRFFTF